MKDCLSCGKKFNSQSKYNRRCADCKRTPSGRVLRVTKVYEPGFKLRLRLSW